MDGSGRHCGDISASAQSLLAICLGDLAAVCYSSSLAAGSLSLSSAVSAATAAMAQLTTPHDPPPRSMPRRIERGVAGARFPIKSPITVSRAPIRPKTSPIWIGPPSFFQVWIKRVSPLCRASCRHTLRQSLPVNSRALAMISASSRVSSSRWRISTCPPTMVLSTRLPSMPKMMCHGRFPASKGVGGS